jgi:hypothetical protein
MQRAVALVSHTRSLEGALDRTKPTVVFVKGTSADPVSRSPPAPRHHAALSCGALVGALLVAPQVIHVSSFRSLLLTRLPFCSDQALPLLRSSSLGPSVSPH